MRCGLVVKGMSALAAITLALLLAFGSSAAVRVSRASHRSIVGTYAVVTHGSGGLAAGPTVHANYRITRFNPATGVFRGTGLGTGVRFYKIRGVVKGSTIEMRVIAPALRSTEHLRGTLRRDGTIAGTATDSNGSRGNWTMTRLWVVVQKTGSGSGDGVRSFGARVVNRSNQDAFGVTVTVETIAGGGVEESENFLIDFIPAGESFVVADSHRFSGLLRLGHAIAYVRVRQMEPRGSGDRLPTVSNVEIDRKNHRVKAVMTNPYPFPVDLAGWHAFALLYDKAGRIIGGGKNYRLTGARLRARGHKRIAIDTAVPMSRVRRAEVTVTPP